ncbi:MAG: hypothetical protein M5U34_04435 [Chloroflexi bacterium]|nr:hypothetical protein [Chloroflexota bacterium]
MREFVQILYLHRDHTAESMAAAIEAVLTHHCAHLDGVQLWLRQLQQPDPVFASLDLAEKPPPGRYR